MAIQQKLGHKNLKNTMEYLKVTDAYVDQQCELARANGAVV